MTQVTTFTLEVNAKLPRRLARLKELANNLWYSWDRQTRLLFSRLDTLLWDEVGHNPTAFLKRVDEQKLVDAADDPVFLGNYNRVLSEFDTYHGEPLRRNGSEWLRQTDLVAYFCAEFGFHESLPIYSGGLGILAGDHCKSASDMRLPFIGVGLLYRQGYFHQTIDTEGNQHALYCDSDFEDLPVSPVLRDDGSEVRVKVDLPGRAVQVKVWQAKVGHVTLYLLDTDLDENAVDDRDITHRLYGGDRTTRIEQEIVLGIGGVRALVELGLKPTAWHINEGHPAFLVLERVRILVGQGLTFDAALEAVAANTVFTTHTPVPAGHDQFSADMMRDYFAWLRKELGMSEEDLLALGRVDGNHEFNMTALAIRGSRFQNGVSRIHGGVSARICARLWPEVAAEENPLSYVTNGVHVPTFLAPEWADQFDKFLGFDWSHHANNQAFWQRIDDMPDHLFWSVRQSLKAQMLHLVRYRVSRQHFRNRGSEAHLDRLLRYADPVNPNVLTIGFARRFATYKRAALLFEDLDWLRQILSDEKRPGPVHLSPARRIRPTCPARTSSGGLTQMATLAGLRGQDPADRGLRPAAGAAAGFRGGRVAEQPGVSAGSERHFRHEGGNERRAQPLGARRLVGRGLRRQERLGNQAGVGKPGRGAPQFRGKPDPLRVAAGPGDPVVLPAR